MRRVLSALCSLFAALGLGACDYFATKELKPGVSTGFEVRDKMGPPTMEWKNDDGSLTWEFARTPMGRQNYMADIGPDNILRALRQVLTDEYFGKVTKGMSREQVRRLLGRPAGTVQFPLKQQEVWDWRFDNPQGRDLHFNVHFDLEGRVVETSVSDETKG